MDDLNLEPGDTPTAEAAPGGRSLEERTAYVSVLERTAVAMTTCDTLEAAAQVALDSVCGAVGWPVGHLYRRNDAGGPEPAPVWHLDDPERFDELRRVTDATPVPDDGGLPARVLAAGRPAWTTDLGAGPAFPLAGAAGDAGLTAAFAFPVPTDGGVVAVLEFLASDSSEPAPALLNVIEGVGRQLGRVAERERAIDDLRRSEERVRGLALSFERQLAERTLRDHLTGLPNRALLLDRLEHALARGGRHHSSVAVLMLDLDRFKAVNDGLGHHVGDELLREVAVRLEGRIRAGDTVARISGDEFAVLFEDLHGREEAVQRARQLLAAFDDEYHLSSGPLSVTASSGAALSGDCPPEPGLLLGEAEAALRRARLRGDGGSEMFDDQMRTQAAQRQATEEDLRLAIGGDQFRLEYQPIVSLRTGAVLGAEALVRWQHPVRGLLPPSDFVPVAEETGLIVALGRWVLAEACRQAVEWKRQVHGRPGLTLSVNVSTHQFRQAEWTDEVARALTDNALAPGQLVIEITESALIENIELAALRLKELRRVGVRLAIDDFGTGYSSLGYLRHLPVDILKIDKSFIDGVTGDPHQSALARAVLKLARTLGLQSVAEGIERHEQLVMLQRLGCALGQGFYLGRPQEPEAITELLFGS